MFADLRAPEPKRAGSIRANFLDSSGTPFFERSLDTVSTVGDSQVRAFDIACGDLVKRLEGVVPPQGGGLSGLSGRGCRA